ncbi:hypothetical protein GCM10010503_40500 [Streptomyces lucensis JCM 4490]|uniref:ATP-grasp domain-containing protein n=1 Tax=Streptomyces lucensis JCM 4490 TaxID=1306176 RepID=A0A918JAI2_9ACTN|nr:hypothetical protein GCM10010503_40500 [Streptomyces lucensis JCM 4490]
MSRHNVSQPRWAEAADAGAAAAHADTIGYPVALKSQAGVGTMSVAAYSRAEVLDGYDRMMRDASSRHGEVVVEELLHGARIRAETVLLPDGDVCIAAITRTTPGEAGLQASRHCVYAHDALLHNPVIRRLVARTLHALGLRPGVFRIGMQLTLRGPRITDVQGHAPDDLTPVLVKTATGIDLLQVAVDVAAGGTPGLTPKRQRASAVHFAHASVTGRIERIAVTVGPDLQPFLERVVQLKYSGDHVVAMPESYESDALAYGVVVGSSPSDCHTALDRLAQALCVDIAPSATAGQGVRRLAWQNRSTGL